MVYDPEKHQCRSIRLCRYDYTWSGAYFVTLCVHNRTCIFGSIIEEEMILNRYGDVAQREWLKTEEVRNNIKLDEFIIMPNHLHGIIVITQNDRTNRFSLNRPAPILYRRTIGSVIGQFKSIVTKQIWAMGRHDFKWQRNYYEHIIRDQESLNKIRQYIKENPIRWKYNGNVNRRGDPVGRPRA